MEQVSIDTVFEWLLEKIRTRQRDHRCSAQ